MVYDQQVQSANIRTEVVDRKIRALTDRLYRWKQAMTIIPTNAWSNVFFREDPALLTSVSQNNVEDSPRGSAPPSVAAAWERNTTVMKAYKAEANMSWEDVLSDDIDIVERSLYKIAEIIAYSVDLRIATTLFDQSTLLVPSGAAPKLTFTNINSVTTPVTTGNIRQWQDTSASIVSNLLEAARKIAENNYPIDNLQVYMAPANFQYTMTYLGEKGAQWNDYGQAVATNGKVMRIAGMDVIVSTAAPASYALVVKPQMCGTLKVLSEAQTQVLDNPLVSRTIRSAEVVSSQLSAPKAVTAIQTTF